MRIPGSSLRRRPHPVSWRLGRRLLSLLLAATPLLASPSGMGQEPPNIIYYGSANGIQGWDALNNQPVGPLGAITNGDWRGNFGITALPKSDRHVVYSRPASVRGLGIWDLFTNTHVGEVADGEGGNWTVTDVSFDPTDDTRLIYGAADSAGLKVWDLTTRTTIGAYRNVTNGNWRGAGFEVVPGRPDWIVYGSSDGLKLWDADANRSVGPFWNVTEGNWRSGLMFAPAKGSGTNHVFPTATRLLSQNVRNAASATFRAKVEGAGSVTQSWLLNGQYVIGAVSRPLDTDSVAELTLTNILKRDEGWVELELRNFYAQIRLERAMLVVDGIEMLALRAAEFQWLSSTDRRYRVEGTPRLGTASVLPFGTPMMLRTAPDKPWQVVTDPAAWVQGSGNEMQVIFSIRDNPKGFYHIAISADGGAAP